MTRLRAFWESARATYWAVPSLMSILAAGLSVAMIRVDERLPATFVGSLSWVYAGGPEGARAVLSTIAGSMITVAGVTFSITIVTLTLASQQFGPRLLRGFLRDLGNQIVLGTFVSTFIYCLLVLRTVRGTDDAQFVPHLAVTIGVLLAMLSIGVLIFFIHHVSTSIQASRIIANVAGDLDGAVAALFPETLGQAGQRDSSSVATLPDEFDRDAQAVPSRAGGYVQAIDERALLALATERNMVLRIDAEPGRFARQGTSLVSAWPATAVNDDVCQSVRAAFIIGSARTPTQDVQFYIQQLVELAVRALSPGINDPGTARMCLDRLGQALCQMATREMPAYCRHDDHGRLRVMARPLTFESMADGALSEIRRYGGSNVSVTLHLLAIIRDVAACVTREPDRMALLAHTHAVLQESRQSVLVDGDRALVEQSHLAALAALPVHISDRR